MTTTICEVDFEMCNRYPICAIKFVSDRSEIFSGYSRFLH